MTTELRIALLLIGLMVLAGLYYFSGRAKRSTPGNGADEGIAVDKREKEELRELEDLIREDSDVKSAGVRKPASQSGASAPASGELVILHVAARRPHKFVGTDVVHVTEQLDLEYGDRHIFHKVIGQADHRKTLYSVMNMVRPGTFEMDAMDEFETPGLSFAMNLPAPETALEAFDTMLEDAKQFADRLGGDLLDESRNRLSQQTITHLRERVQLFDLKHSRRA